MGDCEIRTCHPSNISNDTIVKNGCKNSFI